MAVVKTDKGIYRTYGFCILILIGTFTWNGFLRYDLIVSEEPVSLFMAKINGRARRPVPTSIGQMD